MLERLKEVLEETCKQMDVELIECNGEDEHIHLMVNCPPKLVISNLVGKLKGKSSYINYNPLSILAFIIAFTMSGR